MTNTAPSHQSNFSMSLQNLLKSLLSTPSVMIAKAALSSPRTGFCSMLWMEIPCCAERRRCEVS